MRARTALLMGLALVLAPPGAPAATTLQITRAAAPAPASPSKTPPGGPATAASPPFVSAAPPSPTLVQTIAGDEVALAGLQDQAAATSNDAQLALLAAKAAQIEAEARKVAAGPTAEVSVLQAQLAKVSPRDRRVPRPADRAAVAQLEAELAGPRAALQRTLQVLADAQATYNLIAERRRESFSDRVLTRSDSPLSPQFWTSLAAATRKDGARIAMMVDDEVSVTVQAREPKAGLALAGAMAIAAALVFVGRPWLERLGRRREGQREGVARTGAALRRAIIDTGAPTLAAASLQLGAQWGGLLSAQADAMAQAAIYAVAWVSGVLALGRVLLTDCDPRQRLLPVSDEAARRISGPVLLAALVTGAGHLLSRINYVAGASVAATIAANCLIAMAYAVVAAMILVSFGRGAAGGGEGAADRARAPAWTLVSLVLSVAIAATLGAVFLGYSTLAALVAGQIFWLSLIAATAYLLMRFADDYCAALFAARGWAARALFVLFGFRRSVIAQAGALVGAAAQIVVLAGAVSLALKPFGRSGDLLAANLKSLGAPIRFGSAEVSPGAIAAGVATLVVGVGAARFVQRWVERRYLPVTDWDAGVRNSVATGIGYLGIAIALICALAAAGLGLTQLALVASALSVGIGFGLQQIVQNFVSGVILLVERPVKVGDRVNIGGVEGDVRRIRVRATEIAVSDRSTMIVPNSDFITKQVQNKTLGYPGARVQLQLPIARAADAGKARDLILGVVKANPEVAQDPPAEVLIESLAAGAVNLVCNLYVADTRAAFRVRSACYFAVLDAFQAGDVDFAAGA
jgi:potassium efflux system protein